MEFVVDGERLGEVLGPFLDYDDVTDNCVPVLVTDWPTGIAWEDLDRLLGETVSPSAGLPCMPVPNVVILGAVP
jgi:hypothetical protein